MIDKLKVILGSKIVRVIFSVLMIYWAFRKIDIVSLVAEISKVPLWFVVVMLAYMFITMLLGGWRWVVLLLPHPKFSDIITFTKASYVGGFYSLFFPSAVGGDLLKWVGLIDKYPSINKARLAASVLVDRVIGFTAFAVMALLALGIGKIAQFNFPSILWWLFLGINAALIAFYLVVFLVDIEKIIVKLPWGHRILEVVDLLKKENKNRIVKCFLISLLAEPIWVLPIWFYSKIFKAGMSLLSVYTVIPVISLILVLPISIAGFGARENLYLHFFTGLGITTQKALLVSTFAGIMGILNALLGGIFLLGDSKIFEFTKRPKANIKN